MTKGRWQINSQLIACSIINTTCKHARTQGYNLINLTSIFCSLLFDTVKTKCSHQQYGLWNCFASVKCSAYLHQPQLPQSGNRCVRTCRQQKLMSPLNHFGVVIVTTALAGQEFTQHSCLSPLKFLLFLLTFPQIKTAR